MRKILTFLLLLVGISLFGLTSDTFASTNDTKESLVGSDEVFKKAVDLDLINTKSNGQLVYLGDKVTLGVSDALYHEFLEKIESVNFLVDLEVAKVDDKYNIILSSSEEIADIIYLNDKEAQSTLNSKVPTLNSQKLHSDNGVVMPTAVDNGLPTINLVSLVKGNKKELENYLNAVLKTAPTGAYAATVGYFVGKVREGGVWDYKSQPGYRYWYKEWNASTYSGTKVINTEYIGNYNYAYVGETLFSKSILLIGGGAVGVGVGQPEDAKDKQAITDGYNDAVKYW